MPIKLFTDGEILEAAQVNTFFMDQALCVFDDATERDAAFGLPTKPGLSEGRICYLKSDNTIYIYTGSGWTAQLANIEDGVITSAKILDGAIVNADINASAAIALSKLATGALPTAITVASANLVNGTIVNEDINASAAIGLSKLATGALPTDITVASANLVNGTIVDEDVNASAAIAHSKLASTTAGNILLGTTTTGVITGTAVTGDVTINGAGVTTIGATKVTNGMLAGSIALTKLADGALPSGITVASANITNLTLKTEDIEDGAVSSVKLGSSLTLAGTTSFQQIIEKAVTNNTTTLSSTVTHIDVLSGAVYRFIKSDHTNGFKLNIRGDGSTTLASLMTTNQQAITIVVSVLSFDPAVSFAGTSDYLTIGGSDVAVKWFGGTKPSGNRNSEDFYTFTIFKTGTTAFTVFASQSKFA
jgi:hypothetical protein